MTNCLECGHKLIDGKCLLHGSKYQVIAYHIKQYGDKSPILKELYMKYKKQQKISKSPILPYKIWYQNKIDDCITHGTLIPK